jgi:hypothetical protein
MQPFEFLIRSRPVSQQARRSSRKDAWKDFVRREAERSWGPVHGIVNLLPVDVFIGQEGGGSPSVSLPTLPLAL